MFGFFPLFFGYFRIRVGRVVYIAVDIVEICYAIIIVIICISRLFANTDPVESLHSMH